MDFDFFRNDGRQAGLHTFSHNPCASLHPVASEIIGIACKPISELKDGSSVRLDRYTKNIQYRSIDTVVLDRALPDTFVSRVISLDNRREDLTTANWKPAYRFHNAD